MKKYLFSERRKMAEEAEEWCLQHGVLLDPLGIVSALQSLGHLNKPHPDCFYRDGSGCNNIRLDVKPKDTNQGSSA